MSCSHIGRQSVQRSKAGILSLWLLMFSLRYGGQESCKGVSLIQAIFSQEQTQCTHLLYGTYCNNLTELYHNYCTNTIDVLHNIVIYGKKGEKITAVFSTWIKMSCQLFKSHGNFHSLANMSLVTRSAPCATFTRLPVCGGGRMMDTNRLLVTAVHCSSLQLRKKYSFCPGGGLVAVRCL